MKTQIKKEKDGSLTIVVNVKLKGSLLEQEEQIQSVVNEIGLETTISSIQDLDTDGSPIELEGKKYTSKGKQKKRFIRPTATNL